MTSLQQRLVKTGGRLVKHARHYWLMLAEGDLTRTRFAAMLRRIALFPPHQWCLRWKAGHPRLRPPVILLE